MKLTAAEKLKQLFDDSEVNFMDELINENTGECVVIGYGTVEGIPVWAFSQNISEKSGSFGAAHGKKIKKVFENAIKTGTPVVGIYDSFGGAVSEGVQTLEAYGELIKSANRLSGIAPYISVISGNCAGCAAVSAMTSDFVIMNKEAELFLNPKAVFKGEDAEKAGLVQLLSEDDSDALGKARELLSRLPINNLSGLPAYEDVCKENFGDSVLENVFDDDSILYLNEGFGEEAQCGFALINGESCAFVNAVGKLDADCCEKILKTVSFCDSFNIPLVTFIDSDEFAGEGADIIKKLAKLAGAYAEASNVKVSVITGKAYGAVYVALAGKSSNSDEVFALEDSYIGLLNPETAVALMCGDKISKDKTREEVEEEYKKDFDAHAALKGGYIDAVVTSENMRNKIYAALEVFAGKRGDNLPKKHSNILM